MFDPMELERSRLFAAVKDAEAAEANARHKILEGTMRLHSLPGVPGSSPASGKGRTVLVLLVLTIAAIGYGALEDAPPAAVRAAALVR